MTDTPESLQSALDDLTRRVAAFEKAQKAEEEPPVCSEVLLALLERGTDDLGGSDYKKAAAEIRYLRAELARLREGLKVQRDDECDENVDYWANDQRASNDIHYGMVRARSFAREIQRHRKLVAK